MSEQATIKCGTCHTELVRQTADLVAPCPTCANGVSGMGGSADHRTCEKHGVPLIHTITEDSLCAVCERANNRANQELIDAIGAKRDSVSGIWLVPYYNGDGETEMLPVHQWLAARKACAAELVRLRAWKKSAMTVLAEWDRVFESLGSPGKLGEPKAVASKREAERLRDVERLLKLTGGSLSNIAYNLAQRSAGYGLTDSDIASMNSARRAWDDAVKATRQALTPPAAAGAEEGPACDNCGKPMERYGYLWKCDHCGNKAQAENGGGE